MANYAKFKADAIRYIDMHNGRLENDGRNHSNKDIDNSKTHLNYNIAEQDQPLRATDFIKKRLSEIKVHKSCQTVAIGQIVTLPKDFEGDEKAFFQHAYDFMCDRYGKENVISAWVHYDETQPHLHFTAVPVQLNKKGEQKLCGKDFETKKSLSELHPKLQAYLEEKLGCPCHIMNGATEGGNKTVAQLKNERLAKQNEALEQEVTKKQEKALEYEQTPKKRLTESKEAYEERIATGKQAVAVKQRTSELDEKTQKLASAAEQLQREIDQRLNEADRKAKRIIQTAEQNAQELLDNAERYVQREVENRLVMYDEVIEGKERQIEALDRDIKSKQQRSSELGIDVYTHSTVGRQMQRGLEEYAEKTKRLVSQPQNIKHTQKGR